MNVVFLVVDSLRARALDETNPQRPSTPFFDRLAREGVSFDRAYSSECWTLPSHASMFTGALPSEHGAHLQRMRYDGERRTLAERASARGFHTEIVTRNPIFDGTIPGITRGFLHSTRILAPRRSWDPMAIMLALTKPRFRRQIRDTGFFHPRQRASREFLRDYVRTVPPADDLALAHLRERMHALTAAKRPFFLFCNLYDVHAPYSPSTRSILRPVRSIADLRENVGAMSALPKIGSHEYLRPGFVLPGWRASALVSRYHRAIELTDAKLAAFHDAARADGLLDDTLLVVTSDHGEAFGEHDLYLHDASVYDVHLRVPLWIHHPGLRAERVADVVQTRDLAHLLERAFARRSFAGTLLDPEYRGTHPIALAEHFHTPHVPVMQERYRHDLVTAIGRRSKLVLRGATAERYDLIGDPAERFPERCSVEEFLAECRGDGCSGPALRTVARHLATWHHTAGASRIDRLTA